MAASAILCALSTVIAEPALADAPAMPPTTADSLRTPEPKSALEHNNRAVELGMKGRWSESFREHELALKEDPKNKVFRTNYSGALLRHGHGLLKSGKYKEAVAVLKKAIEIDSNNAPAARFLGEAQQQLKAKASPVKPASPAKKEAQSSK